MTTFSPATLTDGKLEEALGLRTFEPNRDAIARCLDGRVVLVTGAGGSIGSELCRKIASFNPKLLIGLDHAESPLFETEQCLRNEFAAIPFQPVLCNIQNARSLSRVLSNHTPELAYHAAAYKHVPLLESHVTEAVENNVLGTANVVELALANGCRRFTLISTDKAVAPVNVLGATKRLAEMVCLASANSALSSHVNVVRFGNVLNSSGSVTSIFNRQIANGGPVTVTHPEMRRYFLTGATATNFVLEASSLEETGQVFEMDLGEPIYIIDLAKTMIELAGLRPGIDIQILISGQRACEKLTETQDNHLPSGLGTPIRKCAKAIVDRGRVAGILERLRNLVETQEADNLLDCLTEAVPDYKPLSSVA